MRKRPPTKCHYPALTKKNLQQELTNIIKGVDVEHLQELKEGNRLQSFLTVTLSDDFDNTNTTLMVKDKIKAREVKSQVLRSLRHSSQLLPDRYYAILQVYSPDCEYIFLFYL